MMKKWLLLYLSILLFGSLLVCDASEETTVEAARQGGHSTPLDEATAEKELASLLEVSEHVAKDIVKGEHEYEKDAENLPMVTGETKAVAEAPDGSNHRQLKSKSKKKSKIFRGYGYYKGRSSWKGKGSGKLVTLQFFYTFLNERGGERRPRDCTRREFGSVADKTISDFAMPGSCLSRSSSLFRIASHFGTCSFIAR